MNNKMIVNLRGPGHKLHHKLLLNKSELCRNRISVHLFKEKCVQMIVKIFTKDVGDFMFLPHLASGRFDH